MLAGVHRGSFAITLPVHLRGEPGAVLEGPGQGTVLTVSADGVTVADLVVRGSGADLFEDDAVILLAEVEDVTIERCRVEARAFGI